MHQQREDLVNLDAHTLANLGAKTNAEIKASILAANTMAVGFDGLG